MSISMHFDETTEEQIGDGDNAPIFVLGVLENRKKSQLLNRYLRASKEVNALLKKQEDARDSIADKCGAQAELEAVRESEKSLAEYQGKAGDAKDDDAKEKYQEGLKVALEQLENAIDDFKEAIGPDSWDELSDTVDDIGFELNDLLLSDKCMAVYYELIREGLRGWRNIYALRGGKKSEVKFATDEKTLGLLPLQTVRKLADKIISFNTLSEDDAGN